MSEGRYKIRAYCSKCNKLVQESNPLTKKQLRASWDRAVLGAINIKCEDCGTKFPNFELNLKIYDSFHQKEFGPERLIKLPKNHQTPDQLFADVSRIWLKEHPDVTPPTQEEVVKALNETHKELVPATQEEILKSELEKRAKYNGEGQ